MGVKKVAKVWTAAERKRKSEGMKAYWRKRRAVVTSGAVPPTRKQAAKRLVEIGAELRESEFWKVEEQPPGSESLSGRLVKVEIAARGLREALAAL